MPDSPRGRHVTVFAALIATLVSGAAGCGGSDGPATLTVLAASSLTDIAGELGAAYQQEHRDVKVRFVFGGSQEMAERVADRDPGDVLMTADEPSMKAVSRYLTGRRRIVAFGSLTIAVAPGNPHRIRGLRDLSRRGLRVAVGAGTVPVGRYAREIFTRAGLTVRWTSEEINSRSVLDRVRGGEADAGLVYITDLRSAGAAASSVPIPADENVTASYPAMAVKETDNEERALPFVTWLTSPTARKLFNKHGFATPATSTTGPPPSGE
ncbi:molybdate ABC transporter substrate-binding protein [Actinomadura rudentiformis]|uniref:Molybdate ABC transporter substrate-binding protein n=1 Tax=Actinomadura rudentiformis TaxID=359158 RepID=A0A6H9YXC1_9ACTN|nr:molybdate ABC transporter substrate-binding protein [Actinomadura rudentiformis]KAB2345691.1 molybdate ABC transporter substrate-binding protein [Actinomadura rudentiformis]